MFDCNIFYSLSQIGGGFFVYGELFLVVIQQETIAKFAVVEEKPYIRSLKNP